jgi:xylose isomerase
VSVGCVHAAVRKELDNLAAFFHMVNDYKASIGFDAQCLIEPKPREPTKHQYDYDAQTVMGFLNHYGLSDTFKLNIEPNHTTCAAPKALPKRAHVAWPPHTRLRASTTR